MGPHLRELVDQRLPEIVAYAYKVGVGSPVTPAEKKVVKGGGFRLDGTKIIMGNGNNAAGLMTLGTEFGGQRRRHTLQFRPHRGQEGYMFWPNIRHHGDDIGRMWDNLVLELIG
jgi:alkylation response protein AidB-like acyl-CoA dehydrogenase